MIIQSNFRIMTTYYLRLFCYSTERIEDKVQKDELVKILITNLNDNID